MSRDFRLHLISHRPLGLCKNESVESFFAFLVLS
jgi:hypothetical protein